MRQWTVDAFAAQPFRGNPACVLEPLEAWPEDAWMQALAAENNQAETAFLLRTLDPARFGLRWFTPALEVPLCGHATLASGHVLLAELGLAGETITFDTRSGPLVVAAQRSTVCSWVGAFLCATMQTPSWCMVSVNAASSSTLTWYHSTSWRSHHAKMSSISRCMRSST